MITVLLYGIINGLIISLVALAFQINFRIYKMFDLGLAGIYVFTSYYFSTLIKLLPENSPILSFILSLLITCAFSWILSLVIYYLIYGKFLRKKTSALTLMVISLSVYMIIINILAMFFGPENRIVNIQKLSNESLQFGTIVFTYFQIIQLIVCVLTIVSILYILNKIRIGQEIIALSENKELFLTLGLNLSKTRNIALLISGVLIAFSSVLKSIEYGIEPYNTGFQTLLLGIVAVVIGGIHSYKGAIFGGISIGIINNLGGWFFSGKWQDTIAFLLLLIILIFKKNGFFSINLRLEE